MSPKPKAKKERAMNELLTSLQNLNSSNQFDTESTRWATLINCLDEIVMDGDTDPEFIGRLLKRRGFDSKDAVISGIESALESKIAELQGLLNQVKNLK